MSNKLFEFVSVTQSKLFNRMMNNMSLNPNALPENIRRCMAQEDRQIIGKNAETMPEIIERVTLKQEKALQMIMGSLLHHRDIAFMSPKFGKKTQIMPGWPDFTFAINGQACAVEAKVGKNQPTKQQLEVMAHLERNGWKVAVIRDATDFKMFLDKIEKEGKK